MPSDLQKFKAELKELIVEGKLLSLALSRDVCGTKEIKIGDEVRQLEEIKLPDFGRGYEKWYTVALQVLQQILPDRVADFTRLYRDEKRKGIDYLTYGLADYMIGLKASLGGQTVVDEKAAYPKFIQQLKILGSAEARLESALGDMVEVLQADLFDDELQAASELLKKGFVRASGVVAGVVLERHLRHVCGRHNLKTRKKRPTINDFNTMLKDGEVIDLPVFRNIQHLADVRNLCGHSKDREPTSDEVQYLIAEVSRFVKTLF